MLAHKDWIWTPKTENFLFPGRLKFLNLSKLQSNKTQAIWQLRSFLVATHASREKKIPTGANCIQNLKLNQASPSFCFFDYFSASVL
jgi:hypothetical protein